MLIQLGIIFAIFATILYLIHHRKQHERLVPQGPSLKLPLVGHLLFLGQHPHKTLLKWRRKYGPMFRIQLGSFQTVVILDAHLIRKAFNSPALAGRPKMKIFEAMGSYQKDLIFSNGPQVAGLRQFFAESFKIFAANSSRVMEQMILGEANDMVGALMACEGTPFEMRGAFHINIINSLLVVLTSVKYPTGDKSSEKLAKQISSLGDIDGLMELLGLFIPNFCTLAPKWSGLQRRVETIQKIHAYFNSIVGDHKETMVPGQPRDILDAYLEKSRETQDPSSIFHSEAGNLLPFLYNILHAAMETTSSQLEWIIYYMVKYPEIQAKLLDEVDSFVGRARSPSLDDRTSLVFTEAVIQESLRMATIFPLGGYHSALDDFELDGYLIPKDTMIISNLYAVHHDPRVWGDPESFRPERFIDPGTGRLTRHQDLIAFGVGKRRCIGEDLARQQLFLFLVTILQHFSVRPDGSLPSEELFGFTVSLRSLKVVFTRRT